MVVVKTQDVPINCAARNSVWVYPQATPPRFAGAPVIFEIARSHERPDIFSLPEGSDVSVEIYRGAVVLRLEGELHRVHARRFDHVTYQQRRRGATLSCGCGEKSKGSSQPHR